MRLGSPPHTWSPIEIFGVRISVFDVSVSCNRALSPFPILYRHLWPSTLHFPYTLVICDYRLLSLFPILSRHLWSSSALFVSHTISFCLTRFALPISHANSVDLIEHKESSKLNRTHNNNNFRELHLENSRFMIHLSINENEIIRFAPWDCEKY